MKDRVLHEKLEFPNIREMMKQIAELYGDKTAYSFRIKPNDAEPVKKSYIDLKDDVYALATELISRDYQGKHISLIGKLSYNWVLVYYATMAIGSVLVPLDRDWQAADLADTVKKAEADLLIVDEDIAEKGKEICDTIGLSNLIYIKDEGDDSLTALIESGREKLALGDESIFSAPIHPYALALLVFTSGTTGKGKGVMLTQTNIVSDMTQGMYNFAITPKTMLVLPPHHTFGSTVNIVGHFAQNAEIYISSGIKYFQREMKEQQPSHLILVPLFIETLYKRIWASAEKSGQANKLRNLIKVSNGLRKAGVDMRSALFKTVTSNFGGKLEMVICGGAALNQDVIDFFDAIGVTLLNGYGITECAPLISCNRNKYQKAGSVGTPIIGEEVKIADPDENGEGEICVKGPNVMIGYYEDPEATAAAFDEEGFFKTGDYGKVDEEGWLYITGRLKNLIIFSNGKNVYPEEIESEISRIYGVNEVVVYAGESKSNPDKEVIVAEIFPDADALKEKGIEDLKTYFATEVKKANANMVSYKAVGSVKLRDTEFPKNTSRKITRFAIDKTIE